MIFVFIITSYKMHVYVNTHLAGSKIAAVALEVASVMHKALIPNDLILSIK